MNIQQGVVGGEATLFEKGKSNVFYFSDILRRLFLPILINGSSFSYRKFRTATPAQNGEYLNLRLAIGKKKMYIIKKLST